MKVREVEIEIIEGQKMPLKADVTIISNEGPLKENPVSRGAKIILAEVLDKNGKTDEMRIRTALRTALSSVKAMNLGCVAMRALGAYPGIPVKGSAKILAQELLKFIRAGGSSIKQIFIYSEDAGMHEDYRTMIFGYLSHIQDTLGEGPYITVDIIIEMPEGIILIERSNPPYGWALPGGFVDCGESLEDAAIRETKEETHLDLENLKQFHTYSNPERDPRFHTISTVFTAQGQGTPQFGDDAKGLKIIPYRELLNHTYAFDHKDVIKDYLRERKLI